MVGMEDRSAAGHQAVTDLLCSVIPGMVSANVITCHLDGLPSFSAIKVGVEFGLQIHTVSRHFKNRFPREQSLVFTTLRQNSEEPRTSRQTFEVAHYERAEAPRTLWVIEVGWRDDEIS